MKQVGVVGGGTMGAGIAEVCAKAGVTVTVLETTQEFADAELVIEAAPEIESLKTDIFGKLDQVVNKDAILATNTSSIPVIKIANATGRPEKVVGVHFFNPVPVMPLMEVISTLTTSGETASAVTDFVKNTLGKTAVQAGDRSGFIVNALLIPYLLSAVRMYESGYATKEDIDAGMKGGCGHPMGPLTLCDTVGLDVALAAADSMYAEFGEPHMCPPPLLRRMVDAGHLGRKSGKGFYDYK